MLGEHPAPQARVNDRVLPRELGVCLQPVESSRQGGAPETEDAAGPGLPELPEAQDGGGSPKENGCVCRQLLEPAR